MSTAAVDLAERGDFEGVLRLVRSGDSGADACGRDGWTLLHLASCCAGPGIVRDLVSLGADPGAVDERGCSPMHLAAGAGAHEAIEALHASLATQRGVADSNCPRCGGAGVVSGQQHRDSRGRDDGCGDDSDGDTGGETSDEALSFGVCPCAWRAASGARGGVGSRDARGWTPMHWAASRGHVDAVRTLCRLGADIDAVDNGGATALTWATALGEWGAAVALGKEGADASIVPAGGGGPLHNAAVAGEHLVIDFLVSRGAEVDVEDPAAGRTALHLACEAGRPRAVMRLLTHGASPNTIVMDPPEVALQIDSSNQNSGGGGGGEASRGQRLANGAALHAAVRGRNKYCVKAVAIARGDVSKTDALGRTALDLAGELKSQACAMVLVDKGCQIAKPDWPAQRLVDWAVERQFGRIVAAEGSREAVKRATRDANEAVSRAASTHIAGVGLSRDDGGDAAFPGDDSKRRTFSGEDLDQPARRCSSAIPRASRQDGVQPTTSSALGGRRDHNDDGGGGHRHSGGGGGGGGGGDMPATPRDIASSLFMNCPAHAGKDPVSARAAAVQLVDIPDRATRRNTSDGSTSGGLTQREIDTLVTDFSLAYESEGASWLCDATGGHDPGIEDDGSSQQIDVDSLLDDITTGQCHVAIYGGSLAEPAGHISVSRTNTLAEVRSVLRDLLHVPHGEEVVVSCDGQDLDPAMDDVVFLHLAPDPGIIIVNPCDDFA